MSDLLAGARSPVGGERGHVVAHGHVGDELQRDRLVRHMPGELVGLGDDAGAELDDAGDDLGRRLGDDVLRAVE